MRKFIKDGKAAANRRLRRDKASSKSSPKPQERLEPLAIIAEAGEQNVEGQQAATGTPPPTGVVDTTQSQPNDEENDVAALSAAIDTSDLADTTASNPQLAAADKKLLAASHKLSCAIKLYCDSQDREIREGLIVLPDTLSSESTEGAELTAAVKSLSQPQTLLAVIHDVLDKQKGKKVTISARVGGFISTIYPLLSLALETVSSVAEAASFEPVKGAVNGISLVLAIVDKEHEKGADFLKQLDRLSFQARRVSMLPRSGTAIEAGELVKEKATDLMTGIILFFHSALIHFRHDFFYNVGKAVLLGQKEYKEAKADLDLAIAEFDQALVSEISSRLPTAQIPIQNAPAAAHVQVEQWLQAPIWEIEEMLAKNEDAREADTLNWVFDLPELRDWRVGAAGTPSTLWLGGLPGTGKSIIAAYTIQSLRAQHSSAAVAYFFCAAADITLTKLPLLVRTLAAQLAAQLPTVCAHLNELREKEFDPSKSEDALFLLRQLLRSPLARNGSGVVSPDKEVFVILDGVDEAQNHDGLRDLLMALSKLPLKLLVLSRVTAEIAAGLKGGWRRDLTYEDSKGDVQLYVDNAVRGSPNLKKGFAHIGQTDPGSFLSFKAQGNFLYVRLLLDLLESTISTEAFRQAFDALPGTLTDIYNQVFQRFEQRGTIKVVRAILSCALFSNLNVAETEAMVGIMHNDVYLDLADFVHVECGTILRQTKTIPPRFRVVHETFKSYITDPKLSGSFCVEEFPFKVQFLVGLFRVLRSAESTNGIKGIHNGRPPTTAQRKILQSCAINGWAACFFALPRISGPSPSPVKVAYITQLIHHLYYFSFSQASFLTWIQNYIPKFKYGPQIRFFGYELSRLCFASASFFSFFLPQLNSPAINGTHIIESIRSDSKQYYCGHQNGSSLSERILKTWIFDIFQVQVKRDFCHVWLDTDWQDLQKAKMAAQVAAKLVFAKSWKEGTENFRIGNLTTEQLETAANMGGYSTNSGGVQHANYAAGLLALRHDDCGWLFRKAMKRGYESWHVHEGLSEYFEIIGDIDRAISELQQAFRLKSNPPKYLSKRYSRLLASNGQLQPTSGDGAHPVAIGHSGIAGNEDMAHLRGPSVISANLEKEHPKPIRDLMNDASLFYFNGEHQKAWEGYCTALETGIKSLPETDLRLTEHKLAEIVQEYMQQYRWDSLPKMLMHMATYFPQNESVYHRQLAQTYLCQCLWADAFKLLGSKARVANDSQERLDYSHAVNDTREYFDYGHAMLGLGEIFEAIDAFEEALSHGGAENTVGPIRRAQTIGYAYILGGSYAKAIDLFRTALECLATTTQEELAQDTTIWPIKTSMESVDNDIPQILFNFRLQLGLCYEAVGDAPEAAAQLSAAIAGLKPLTGTMDVCPDRNVYYRYTGRTLFHIGRVEAKLGRYTSARETLRFSLHFFHKSAYENDTQVEKSEEAEAFALYQKLNNQIRPSAVAAAVVSSSNTSTGGEEERAVFLDNSLDLKETLDSMQLRRRIALKYLDGRSERQRRGVPREKGEDGLNLADFFEVWDC